MSKTVQRERALIGTPDQMAEEIAHFRGEVKRFQAGEIPPEKFQAFRLRQGLYGQRGAEGKHMMRLKFPYGRMDPEQMEAVADMCDQYAEGPAHVTTRQDFQYHFVPLEHAADTFEGLAAGGITTREACGNTVRNVTACHLAGVCSQEIFDTLPYAREVVGFFLRHPRAQNMPRKFKIAFSGCKTDCAHTLIHDLGFEPAVKDGRYGFRMVVGGGLGFLWFNASPAELFMGDVGALALGGALGTIAVLIRQEILLAVVGGVFVVETLSVIVQVASFKLTGKRVFLMAPIHHHFEKLGWAEQKIVVRFWIVSAILGLVALSSLKLR